MTEKWIVEFKPRAFKELKKLDRPVQKQIFDFLDTLSEGSCHPRSTGKALQGNQSGMWRYRVGDYRILCEIQDSKLIIHILAVGHRKEVYKVH